MRYNPLAVAIARALDGTYRSYNRLPDPPPALSLHLYLQGLA